MFGRGSLKHSKETKLRVPCEILATSIFAITDCHLSFTLSPRSPPRAPQAHRPSDQAPPDAESQRANRGASSVGAPHGGRVSLLGRRDQRASRSVGRDRRDSKQVSSASMSMFSGQGGSFLGDRAQQTGQRLHHYDPLVRCCKCRFTIFLGL